MKNRKKSAIYAAITLILVLTLAVLIYRYLHTFSTSRWITSIESRDDMIADLLDNYSLIGMKKEEIINLLGEDTSVFSEARTFKIDQKVYDPEQTLIYYLGIDLLEARWLIILFDNNVAIDYCFDVS